MAKLRQFSLLVWKNFILQIRRPVATFFELALPLLFSALLVVIRTTVETTVYNETTTWKDFGVNSLPSFRSDVLPADRTFQVAFVPANPMMSSIMDNFETFLENAKTDIELACPGVSLLSDPNIRRQLEGVIGGGERNSGGPGEPGSAGDAAGNSSGGPDFTFSTPLLPMMAVLRMLPDPIQDFLDVLAANASQPVSEYISTQYNTLGDAFIGKLVSDFMEQTTACVYAFYGYDPNQSFGGGSSWANTDNSNATGNSSSGMNNMLDRLMGMVPKVQAISFENEGLFDEFMTNDTNLAKTIGGVIFSRALDASVTDYNYRLRLHADPINVDPTQDARFTGISDTWRTNRLFPSFQTPGPREKDDIYGGRPSYYEEGFLSMMHAVDMAILATLSNTSVTNMENQNLRLKRFPYHPYVEDGFLTAISSILPLLLMLSFFYTALVIVKSVVHEKETKLKEYLMMTGLSSWLHWLAWFTKYIVFLGISCVFIAILYKIPTDAAGPVLRYTDGTVLFVYLLSFSAATICFCFMLSVFFSKANVAAAAGGVLYGLAYMPYLFIARRYDSMSWTLKAVSCLISNVAMANGATVLSRYEGAEVGAQWYNLNTPVSVDDTFTMFHALLFLWIDAAMYMIIAWYIEGVRPGEYGIPKPWYFPCMPSYWCGTGRKRKSRHVAGSAGQLINGSAASFNGEKQPTSPDEEFFELEVLGLKKIVEICGLRKVFNPGVKQKVAVDSLDLNMYEGQITVLLGHNGAGKTTTMSMLTGLFPPTSGYANVLGHDITTDIDSARESMGLCPQHDILYDQLTVNEHLYFFSRLKGLSASEAKKESKNMLEILQLTDKHSARSATLSGGMKRKLSVGLALCAGSKFIVLDEPTAGMDPSARRAIWDIVQKYRNNCSILLSTHFMDEADLLGDRIAIMADGKLRCAGSSAFLKNKFGVGYHVIMNKTTYCDIDEVTRVFQTNVPESRLERTAGSEVSYLLPFESSHLFQGLFTDIDAQMEKLGILSYGASITTMEEVFLTVTEDVQKTVSSVSRRFSITATDDAPVNTPTINASDVLQPPGDPVKGVALWFQQFKALFIKRVLHTRRHLKVSISQLLVPVVFVILAIINAQNAPFLAANISRSLTLDAYGQPNYVRYNQTPDIEQFVESYTDQFSGVATPIFHNGDLEQYLSRKFEEIGGGFNSRNIIAGSLRNNNDTANSTIAWFNAQAYHASANTLLYADQGYIRWKLNNSNFQLRVFNDPLPRNSSARIQEQLIGSISGFMIAFNAVLGFAFLSASFSIFIVRERTDRASLLQSLTGVDPFCFWLSGFAWDFINFIIPCLVCMIVFVGFNVVEYVEDGQIWITLLIFVLYCWSSLPLTYLMSLAFTLPTTALVSITIFGAILGLATIITINVLVLIGDDSSTKAAEILDWIFLLLPQYCVGQGLSDLYTNDRMVNICTSNEIFELLCRENGIDFQTNFLAWEQYGVGRFVVFMFCEGLLFFAILFAIEYDISSLFYRMKRRFGRVNKKQKMQTESPPANDPDAAHLLVDEDVIKEQNRIVNGSRHALMETDFIVTKQLRKVYTGKKGSMVRSIVAVDELSFGVPKGECFGLLGINGAGKTTTFKMLTGDIRPTLGTAYINKQDIVTSKKLAQQNIGYCPQFNGLIEQMTGAETLAMYARLRGVREKHIPGIVDKLSELLYFKEHINKVCGTYSGGNKRKLSTAIALVGGPAVVLLDEPSTGMDPGARRKLWDTISSICTGQRSIILTSHSMEECEALCTRLAIMVNGQLRCIGGSQHLKTKFGQGYSVEVKLATIESDLAPVRNHLMETFPGAVVKDEHQGMIALQVPKTKEDGTHLSLATIFGCMEEAKQQFQLRDYSVSQTTLEQVFLSFARQQREADESMS